MRALAACAVAAVSLHSLEAAACGCFASTTVADPVIQAGERLVFATEGNKVTAYVQIKFQGEAQSFGWLVPVPAVPDVKVGTDELFEVLDETTRPQFSLTTTQNPSCRPINFSCGCGAGAAIDRSAGGMEPAGPGPLVLRDTAGPYEYAVLKADSKAEMQGWLNTNGFFVPGTSDAALAPYIRPGAFFLALKLRSGQTTGDLRPIVLQYTSDYAMIPIILTSATAVPNMGVQVFLLGSGRAIPRNYHHVTLNPLKLDWSTAENYGALVTAAVAEAPKKHAFVTEYAGSASVARGQLTPFGRFGSRLDLESAGSPEQFVAYLRQHGYAARGGAAAGGSEDLPAVLLGILETQIPYPLGFVTAGISRQTFFRDLPFYLSSSTQSAHADWYMGWPGTSYDGPSLAAAVWTGYVLPIQDAERLLEKPYLTRMFTTLSPEDMNEDPVFAYNATLPEVPALRSAARVTGCSDHPTTFSAGGYTLPDESRLTQEKKDAMPAAAKVELLQEEGAPVEVSSYVLDMSLTGAHGCAAADGAFIAGLAAVWLLLRRRKIQ